MDVGYLRDIYRLYDFIVERIALREIMLILGSHFVIRFDEFFRLW